MNNVKISYNISAYFYNYFKNHIKTNLLSIGNTCMLLKFRNILIIVNFINIRIIKYNYTTFQD